MDKEINTKKMEAEIRRLSSLVKFYEKEELFSDRIADIVRDAVESLPSIKPPEPHVPDTDKKEESVLLYISDVHIGKKTKSYNPRVFVKRLNTLKENVFDIVDIHRSVRSINKLYIAFGGDLIDAESVYPAQAVEHISIPIIDQIFTVGLPEFTKFLLDCSAYFPEIECHCVRGNHGKQNAAKWTSSKSTNWDFVFYKALEAATKGQDSIKWIIPVKDWKDTFKIYNEGFLITHGDMIKRYYSSPFYGMTRQAERWANAYRDKMKLTHFMFGHFHSLDTGMRHNRLRIYVNGSFVTDDPFAEENIGTASVPEQLVLGVHPTKGVTWRYGLNLE
ncbi:MAG TPA: hypothetical protein PK741_10910 [Petrotogaceae bacterium]|nr:hypothetical protein [Petrotogaceae bacterium]